MIDPFAERHSTESISNSIFLWSIAVVTLIASQYLTVN